MNLNKEYLTSFLCSKARAQGSRQGQGQTSVAAIAAPLGLMAAVLIIVGGVFWKWWRKKKNDEIELKQRIQRVSVYS